MPPRSLITSEQVPTALADTPPRIAALTAGLGLVHLRTAPLTAGGPPPRYWPICARAPTCGATA